MREVVRAFLDGGKVKEEIEMELCREGEAGRIVAVYLGRDEDMIDLKLGIRCVAPRVRAEILVCGILSGKARKNLEMTLDIAQGARGVVAQEKEDVMLVADGARNRTVPRVNCREKEVTVKHAVAVGRIDERELFGLMQKGLKEMEARRLLMRGKLRQVLGFIEDKETLRLVEEKLDAVQL